MLIYYWTDEICFVVRLPEVPTATGTFDELNMLPLLCLPLSFRQLKPDDKWLNQD
jgi:hypothetical protein